MAATTHLMRLCAGGFSALILSGALGLAAPPAEAATLTFSDADVTITSTPAGNVLDFDFAIGIGIALAPGDTVSNPFTTEVDYNVSGSLDPGNPSGFPAFGLLSEHIVPPGQQLSGAMFYGNGGSLDFIIAAGADLSDGLQVSELDLLSQPLGYSDPISPVPGQALNDDNAVLVLDAREVGTGRYHPPLLILKNDGTGFIMNSNNTGVNGQTGRDIVATDGLDYGLEYITTFTYDPAALTLVSAPVNADVPLPPAGGLLLAGLAGLWVLRRRGL